MLVTFFFLKNLINENPYSDINITFSFNSQYTKKYKSTITLEATFNYLFNNSQVTKQELNRNE